MRKISILVIVVLLLIIAGAYFLLQYAEDQVNMYETPTPTPTSTAQVQGNSDNNNITGNIIVNGPDANEIISSPAIVTGFARTFENAFTIRIKDSSGRIIKEVPAMVSGGEMGNFNPFSVGVVFSRPSSDTGTIEVFEYSAKDGSEINKVVIPIRFR